MANSIEIKQLMAAHHTLQFDADKGFIFPQQLEGKEDYHKLNAWVVSLDGYLKSYQTIRKPEKNRRSNQHRLCYEQLRTAVTAYQQACAVSQENYALKAQQLAQCLRQILQALRAAKKLSKRGWNRNWSFLYAMAVAHLQKLAQIMMEKTFFQLLAEYFHGQQLQEQKGELNNALKEMESTSKGLTQNLSRQLADNRKLAARQEDLENKNKLIKEDNESLIKAKSAIFFDLNQVAMQNMRWKAKYQELENQNMALLDESAKLHDANAQLHTENKQLKIDLNFSSRLFEKIRALWDRLFPAPLSPSLSGEESDTDKMRNLLEKRSEVALRWDHLQEVGSTASLNDEKQVSVKPQSVASNQDIGNVYSSLSAPNLQISNTIPVHSGMVVSSIINATNIDNLPVDLGQVPLTQQMEVVKPVVNRVDAEPVSEMNDLQTVPLNTKPSSVLAAQQPNPISNMPPIGGFGNGLAAILFSPPANSNVPSKKISPKR